MVAGVVQVTFRVVLPVTVTVGAAGESGGSSTSLIVSVTAIVALPPLPSSAVRTKENSGVSSKS